jgi:hypothetical protein
MPLGSPWSFCRVYYSKLNTILTECSWGDRGRLKLYDKNSREIPAEYTTVHDLPRNIQLILCLVYCSILCWDLPGVFVIEF